MRGDQCYYVCGCESVCVMRVSDLYGVWDGTYLQLWWSVSLCVARHLPAVMVVSVTVS